MCQNCKSDLHASFLGSLLGLASKRRQSEKKALLKPDFHLVFEIGVAGNVPLDIPAKGDSDETIKDLLAMKLPKELADIEDKMRREVHQAVKIYNDRLVAEYAALPPSDKEFDNLDPSLHKAITIHRRRAARAAQTAKSCVAAAPAESPVEAAVPELLPEPPAEILVEIPTEAPVEIPAEAAAVLQSSAQALLQTPESSDAPVPAQVVAADPA